MIPILVTQRLTYLQPYNETRECLDIEWASFLKKCGLVSIPVPINSEPDQYFSMVKPSGILLTGGNNIHDNDQEDPLNRLRDRFETKMIKKALSLKLPIIGVCRGMQILGNFFGFPMRRVTDHVGRTHTLITKSNSIIREIYSNRTVVNSYHSFSLQSVYGDFIASAFSKEDNQIEAFESKHKKIVGIMWHPERQTPFNSKDISLFRSFFN